MGMSRWSAEDWALYSARTHGKSAGEIFKNKSIDPNLDPRYITMRESRDSELNPNSTPIIVAVDNTGSMGILAESLIRTGLGVLLEEIYARKPVPDPHVMCMAFGDAWCDRAPLQATQFEADIRLAEQLSQFWIEGGGGGNNCESYNLPWYFATTRTKCDSFLKRQKKGYLFTVGDEPPPPVLLAQHVDRFLGGGLQHDISTTDLLRIATSSWEVFHIMIEEGSHYRRAGQQTARDWQRLLGQRAIALSDHTKLAELIVSAISVAQGEDIIDVVATWSSSTAPVIRKSLSGSNNFGSFFNFGLLGFGS